MFQSSSIRSADILLTYFADSCLISPVPAELSPFAFVTNDSKSLAAMRVTEHSTHHLILSDWTHLTSDQYVAAEKASGYDPL